MKIYQPLYEYDLFGYTIRLYTSGNTKEGTLFGLIITLIYIFCFIGVTIYYITEVISRKNYSFSTSNIKHEKAVSIQLDKDIFELNLAMQHPETYADYIDETIYYIKANLIIGIRNSTSQNFTWSSEEIKTGPCSLDMFLERDRQFYINGYKNKYCLYDIYKKNLIGHYNFDHYSRIVISFYPCVNSTENNNHCKPKNIIDYYLNGSYLGMSLKSLTVDENEIPMTKTYIETSFTTIGQNFYRDYQIFLKIVETEEDNNIIFNSKKFKKILQLDYFKEMFTINHKINDNSFCDITVKLSDLKTVYKKNYEKLPNALYKVGGLLPVIYYIIRMLLWFPVKTVYEINAVNKVFKFDMTKTIKKDNKINNISNNIDNFNNESYVLKKEIKENDVNILKLKNNEDSKDNSRSISNPKFSYSKKSYGLKLNMQSVKDLHSDSNANINMSNNSNLINIINKKKLINNNNNPVDNFKENKEKEIENQRVYINKQEETKYIVDAIKISWYQFLFCYSFKKHSSNIKITMIENGRKFYKRNLDIINVFTTIITTKKLNDYVLTNKKIFGLPDNNNNSFYDRPIIYNNNFG